MVTPDLVRLSPNYNNRPPRGGVVIIHATRSTVSMNPSEFEGTLNYFSDRNSEASSHWLIGRDGRKARVVPDNLQAWHAAEDNAIAWGIELEQGVESDGFPLMQMESLIEVSRDYVAMGVPAQRIYTTSAKGFVGHQDTAQGKRFGKSDPGGGFAWNAFIAALEEDEMTPEEKAELQRLILAEMDFRVVEKQLTEAVQALQRQGGASEARMRAIAQEEDGRLKVTK